MPYDFAENEFELEPAASAARAGGPPRKFAGIDVVDPPEPPKHPANTLLRILGTLMLVAIAAGILFLLFARR